MVAVTAARHRTREEIDAALAMLVRASAEPMSEAQGRLLLEPFVDLLDERDELLAKEVPARVGPNGPCTHPMSHALIAPCPDCGAP